MMLRRQLEVPILVKAILFHITLLVVLVYLVRMATGHDAVAEWIVVGPNSILIALAVLYVPPIMSIGLFRRSNAGFGLYSLSTLLYVLIIFLWSKAFDVAHITLEDAASFGFLALTTLPVTSVTWAILSRFPWI